LSEEADTALYFFRTDIRTVDLPMTVIARDAAVDRHKHFIAGIKNKTVSTEKKFSNQWAN